MKQDLPLKADTTHHKKTGPKDQAAKAILQGRENSKSVSSTPVQIFFHSVHFILGI